MEIDPKTRFDNLSFGTEDVAFEHEVESAEPGMAPPSPAFEAESPPDALAVSDPLQTALADLVRGKDLSDPGVYNETGRQVLQEILTNLFGDTLFQNLNAGELLDTFQGFIQEDPVLKEVFQNFLNGLSQPGRS
jgi:hypothetical protein